MRRFTLAAGWLVCLPTIGCVEGEQVFTLNPDGSGKMTMAKPAGSQSDHEKGVQAIRAPK